MAKVELGFECRNLKSQMVSNTRIHLPVLTFGQPRSAKGKRTRTNATENLLKRTATRPVRSVNLT